jgi:RNA polymerase sigma factor (sigma-70 family)
MPAETHRPHREESDETLMARYAAGDTEAFDELFTRYEPRAFAYFVSRTASSQRAEDLYQELFVRIHQARDRYDPARPFTPWFFQIAHHLLIDDRRRAFRRHELQVDDWESCEDESTCESRAADREQVDHLLSALSPEERYAVLSAKIAGISYAELAEHLGRSADAVKKMVSRAVLRLRSQASSEVPIGVDTG